jgi:hypothetical protein
MGTRYFFTDIGDLEAPYPPDSDGGLTPVENIAATSYALTGGEGGECLNFTAATAITLTIPPDTDVDFEIGTTIVVIQGGAGAIAFTAGAGVTLNSFNSATQSGGQFAGASLLKTAADTWLLSGNLTT